MRTESMLLAALAGAALPAAAQDRPDGTTAIAGVVRDSGGLPVPGAEIRVIVGPRSDAPAFGWVARADTTGAYRIGGLRPGAFFLRVRRLGYAPAQTSVTVAAGERRAVDVVLASLPATLARVEVRAKSGYSAIDELNLRDFQRRRRQGSGVFLSRDDLQRRFSGAGDVATVVRAVGAGSGGCQPNGTGAETATGVPATQLVVNGDFWRTNLRYGNVSIDEVDAIEIYRANSLPPSWFVSRRATWVAPGAPAYRLATGPRVGPVDARAGGCVVVLWTRS